MKLRYRVVDVFADRALAGNPLCVVLDPCPAELMQALARETNLSETTFPTVTGDDAYDVRIFTPRAELPFAGHPTLGTAWTLGPQRWTQSSPGARVTVDADGDGARMTQPVPTLASIDPAGVAEAAGLSAVAGVWAAEAGGTRHVIVATEAPIEDIRPDLGKVADFAAGHGATTFAVVRRRSDAELHVRVFAPGSGIAEDPGTGSVAGPIAVATRQLWATAAVVEIRQGDEIQRPSTITVDVSGPAPVVGGRVTASADGLFTV